jgi:hypothetical protein
MATGGQVSAGYALSKSAYGSRPIPRIRPARQIEKAEMKLTLRQRLGNWLLNKDPDEDIYARNMAVEDNSISSNGMRFNLYKAAGGFVIETKIYDDRNDRNINKLHVITEEQDLGDAIGKIITMESLR